MDSNDKNTKSVLVVDDDESFRKVLTGALEGAGLTVYAAPNGEEGLTVALEKQPNLTLLDILMPGMDGIETLKKIRADERGKNLKVIVFTQVEDLERMSEALTENITGYMIKADWNVEDMVNEVKKHVGDA